MKVKEVFQKDPLSWRLVNEGVSSNNDTNPETLAYELRTFVCEGEYHTGLVQILQGYLANLGKEQKAAWVSGFYGSGKSHLVKVLRYLWIDYALGNGQTARSVATLPEDVNDLLRELSTEAKRSGGLHMAGGTLKAGAGSVRLRLLGIVLQSVGLPDKVSLARLLMDLKDEGKLEAVVAGIRKLGKDPVAEFNHPYTSVALHKAYLESFPDLGTTQQVAQALLADYPAKVDEITMDFMLKLTHRALAKGGKLPCTVVVLDEVQQFIGDDNGIALEVQEVVEACSKQLEGKVLFVGTGQSALSGTASLQKLMGRFTIKVHLKDIDVERVVRTVVLQKKEDKKKTIEDLVSKYSGEITRQLKTTKLATRTEDDRAYVADYPILPVRRRFWEHVLHSVDPSGTAAQMRTQLRVAHEASRSVANKDLGAVIPADFLYDQIANDLVNSGEMQSRFQQVIEEQKTKTDGELRRRLCGLVFLINKLPRNGGDTGVRATPEHLADLLTDDLTSSATAIREKVPGLLMKLGSEGVLMDIEGEYRLQTTEGAAWEAEYRRRRSALLNNEAQIAVRRGQELSKTLQAQLAGLSHIHGQAKVARKVLVHHGSEKPGAMEGLTVWVRDGFQESEASISQDIQSRSVEDATIHVLIPKSKADDIKQALAGEIAAEETINYMGNPTAQDGQDAKASMVSRMASEGLKADNLMAEVIRGSRVFLSGGQELSGSDLRGTVQGAAGQVLQRLYPKFGMADSPNWGTVWKKAKEGSPSALSAIGHNGDPDKHPVAAELIRFIGAGKKGTEIVSNFTEPLYGWPKDAVDGTLATLLVSGHLIARLQGQPVRLAELDQRKISQADFRIQHPVLSPAQMLKVKRLFVDAGYTFIPGEEGSAAPGFVQFLRDLSRLAGGAPPAPEPPQAPEVTSLEGLQGNDLPFALFEKQEGLSGRIQDWKKTASKIEKRLPTFQLAERLVEHGQTLPGFDSYLKTLDAIRKNRSLLDDPDPLALLLKDVGGALRGALTAAHSLYQDVLTAERERLEDQPEWKTLPEGRREGLLASADLRTRPLPGIGSDSELLQALDASSLSTWRTQTDALSTRFDRVLTTVIQESKPKARRIALPTATVTDEPQLEDWLNQVRKVALPALKDGPLIF